MANIVKVKTTAIALSNVTPNTVSNATVVRINHAGTGSVPQCINISNTGGVYASIYINPQSSLFLQKQSTDTVATNAATTDVTVSGIAFSQ